MKTFALISVATLSVLSQWSLPFTNNVADQTLPFTAAPSVAIYSLDD